MIDFNTVTIDYDKSLAKEKKKKLGIFYTDLSMTEMVINEISINAKETVIDPSCGTGSFLLSLKKMGVPVENIYGADIDKEAVKIADSFMCNNNIVNLDTISLDSKSILKSINKKDKFDVVIGNPPYAPLDGKILIDTPNYLFLRTVKDSGNNLFVAAMIKGFELLKKDGVLAYIIPKNFLHVASYKLLRKKMLKEKEIVSIVDIGAYFKNVRGEQIVLVVRNSKPKNNNILIKKLENNVFVTKCEISQKFYDDEIILFDSKADLKIYTKLSNSYQRFSDVCKGYVGRGKSKDKNAISGREIRKFGFKERIVPQKGNQLFIQNIYSSESGIIASFAGNLEAKETVTVFTDGDEKMCRYILGLLHSRLCNYYLYKYCFNSSKLTMHTDAKYLKKIPLEIDTDTFDKLINTVKFLEKVNYLSKEWFEILSSLNNLVYQTYDLSDDEINHIEIEVKKIQSDRWNND